MSNWRGILPAAITPFRQDLSIDVDAFQANLARLKDAGCAAIVINAVTGEGPSLSADEREECVRRAVAFSAGSIPVIASVGSVSEGETVDDIRRAEKAGADGLMVMTPYFYRLSSVERVEHFKRMGRATDLPFIIYNTTYASAMLSLDELEAIASSTPGFVGLKEGSQLQASEAVRRLSPQVAVYTSRDTYIHELGTAGGAGAVTYTSNVVPELTVALWRALDSRDFDKALALQYDLNPLALALVTTSFPGAVKAAMNMLGWHAGPVRVPLLDFSEEEAMKLLPLLRKVHPWLNA